MKKENSIPVFLWRITYSHMIAYFVAGLFAVTFMNYRTHYASESLSYLMRSVESPIVALGPGLQIVRGLILGIILLPLRKTFVEDKTGFLKLALLLLGLSYLSTIGPTPGSFEGFVYTILPIQYHILGLPETILYLTLFTAILWGSYKKEKRWIFVLSIIAVTIICLLSVLGYLSATGKI